MGEVTLIALTIAGLAIVIILSPVLVWAVNGCTYPFAWWFRDDPVVSLIMLLGVVLLGFTLFFV